MRAAKPKHNKALLVYAYAFDAAGFTVPSAAVEGAGYTLQFLSFNSEASLEEADALIIPSGVFEEFYVEDDWMGHRHKNVRYSRDLLAGREKQLFNAFKRGVWMAFLLGKVDDGDGRWTDTDLAKKFLHIFATGIQTTEADAYITCKTDEFRKFLDRFGIAQTTFWIKDSKTDARVLATSGQTPVSVECRGQFFFLPFFTTKKSVAEVVDAATFTTEAILEYKRKNDIYLPAWLKELRFATEAILSEEVQRKEEELIRLNDELAKWNRYKGVLSTSGRHLNEIAVEILRDFFQLKLSSEEKFVEDALILNDDETPRMVVEIKGVNGGLKREHLNQVDSHRERLGLGPEVVGLLLINDFMDLDGIEARKEKTFDANHLSHAMAINVRILRAVSLFELMTLFEQAADRKDQFLALCESGDPLVESRSQEPHE